jgi:hypothetical protein
LLRSIIDNDKADLMTLTPRLRNVQCLDARGLHRMAYWEWGAADNPRVLVCVHGLSSARMSSAAAVRIGSRTRWVIRSRTTLPTW